MGAGKPKEVDPVRGPLVRQTFEMYATGGYTLRELTAKVELLGLRNSKGNPLRLTQIHWMLRNVFYTGIIRSARFGIFRGVHEAIVKPALFDVVQGILAGKVVRRSKRHAFLFRRLVRCVTCARSLVGSLAKGRVYYRCPTVTCPTTSFREDEIDTEFRRLIGLIRFDDDEAKKLEQEIVARECKETALLQARKAALTEALAAANARVTRLTDLLIDGRIESAAHDERRGSLVLQRRRIEEELEDVEAGTASLVQRAAKIVELARAAQNLYETGDATHRRRLLEIVMSNCTARGKQLDFSLREPFAAIAKRRFQQGGRRYWDTDRTVFQ
jgi:hypothetical protein